MATQTARMDKTVKDLVKSHFRTTRGIQKIVWFPDAREKEIRLVEVNKNTFPTDSVQVFSLMPTEEVGFPVKIADVTPEEWKKIEKKELKLPKGWAWEQRKTFRKPSK